jgi:TRAP transporter TAXI family solute receptor
MTGSHPTRRYSAAAVTLMAVLAAGCARGADEERVQADLQARLDRDVKADLFDVVALRREGSAPLPPSESGAARVVVYFNTTLRVAQDYTFGGWDQLAPSSVAYALGATAKGVFGLKPQNVAGDMVRAYGSAVYEEGADGWTLIAGPVATKTAAPDINASGPTPRSKQLIDQLAALVNLPSEPQKDEIIADELARATENIERRVRRREHTFTIATGAEDSEYARFGETLIEAINQAAQGVKLRQRYSDGSVDNAWLLSRGEADYAIIQGDVAAAAMAGEDVFSRGAPLATLRAVGGLFPEAIHVAVRPDSPIRGVAQLRGRKVGIGPLASGTRFDAVAVLAAFGLTPADLAEASEEASTAAIERLRRGQLDAVFVTASPPMRALQRLAAETGIRLLPMTREATQRLADARAGLTPLTLPANTYPRQAAAVQTVAAVALLVTTSDAPAGEVERVADLVFGRMTVGTTGGADLVKVSPGNELRGVTIPLHPGAASRAR